MRALNNCPDFLLLHACWTHDPTMPGSGRGGGRGVVQLRGQRSRESKDFSDRIGGWRVRGEGRREWVKGEGLVG